MGASSASAQAPVASASTCDEAIDFAQSLLGWDTRDHHALQNYLDMGIREGWFFGVHEEQARTAYNHLRNHCPQGQTRTDNLRDILTASNVRVAGAGADEGHG
ncbi:hypothetical protein P3L51_04880 [Streptomyces sp. PSRA5]|uniref:hypothetical protein n=1 Tax=Streptomyces panacea TaxID=3035064 RepID=UPI00339C22DB